MLPALAWQAYLTMQTQTGTIKCPLKAHYQSLTPIQRLCHSRSSLRSSAFWLFRKADILQQREINSSLHTENLSDLSTAWIATLSRPQNEKKKNEKKPSDPIKTELSVIHWNQISNNSHSLQQQSNSTSYSKSHNYWCRVVDSFYINTFYEINIYMCVCNE